VRELIAAVLIGLTGCTLGYQKDTPEAIIHFFPGFPESGKDARNALKIDSLCEANGYEVVFHDLNQKLWLTAREKDSVKHSILKISGGVPILLGGFSSGGNIAFLLAEALAKSGQPPAGVFAIDSPLDLYALHQSAKNSIDRLGEQATDESKWLLWYLESELGNPQTDLSTYESLGVYTAKTNNLGAFGGLKETSIWFYTEPDSLWWMKNRSVPFQETNAFVLTELDKRLREEGFRSELIITTDKGYRPNGDRHPHSYSIVDLQGWLERVKASVEKRG
jgi:hypothetical protein